MACPVMVADQPFHVRSVSMPSRPQPLALRVKEELQKLRTCVASTSSAAPQMMCNGLRELGNLYDCIEDILHLPRNQKALTDTHQRKLMEKELDESIKVLDLCTAMRDNLVAMKEHAQDLGLALRRQDSVTETKLQAFNRSGKKAQKEMKNLFTSLKQTDNKFRSLSTLDSDCDLLMVIRMLMDAREITISLLQAVSSSLFKPKEPKDKRWSFVSKVLRPSKVACEDELEYTNEAETFEQVETGLDCLFRRLILSRVSLLNIISL